MGTASPIRIWAVLVALAGCSAEVQAPPTQGGGTDGPADDANVDGNEHARQQAGDGDADADADTDADADGDADGDADADADGDADGDADEPIDDGGGDAPLDGCADAASCDDMARQLFDALNAARAAAAEGNCGGGPLAWDDALAAVAEAHSAHMAAVGQLTNDDPAGGIDARLAHLDWSSAGEVYGVVPGTAAEAIADFLAEPPIREYLLTCEWPLVGVGVAPAALPQAPAWVTLTMIAR